MKTISIIFFLLCISYFESVAQLTGCYSVPSGGGLGRFYYRQISGNNYNISPYATSGSASNCNTFSNITLSSTPCQVSGVTYSYTFLATANVPMTCVPLDDYFIFCTIPFALIGLYSIRIRALVKVADNS